MYLHNTYINEFMNCKIISINSLSVVDPARFFVLFGGGGVVLLTNGETTSRGLKAQDFVNRFKQKKRSN